MKNLDQIRAVAALPPSKKLKRSAIAKLPSLIINNGLIAAAAYCNAEGGGANKNDLQTAMKETAKYLSTRKIVVTKTDKIEDFIDKLCHLPSAVELQYATAEALAYLSYLKRFATNDQISTDD